MRRRRRVGATRAGTARRRAAPARCGRSSARAPPPSVPGLGRARRRRWPRRAPSRARGRAASAASAEPPEPDAREPAARIDAARERLRATIDAARPDDDATDPGREKGAPSGPFFAVPLFRPLEVLCAPAPRSLHSMVADRRRALFPRRG